MTEDKVIEILRSIRVYDVYPKEASEETKQAIEFAINALEENKGLRLLVEWAVQCDFGYDNFPEEYEKYKEQVKDMDYVEGMIYIASKEAKND